ncbi:hypothetical protein LTR66_016349, partial [Elasticomyces elasticus]
LVGREGFEHYLLCYQFVLRKQVYWLVHEKDLPAELETIVHDLWSLRLQGLQSRVPPNLDADAEKSRMVFSSQSEGDIDTENESRGAPEHNNKVSGTPRLLDAIALCYVGILLLRLPVTVGDLHAWVNTGQLLYYAAHKALPSSMKERLAGTYHNELYPNILQPDDLHHTVLETVALYEQDYGMSIPPLNSPLLLYRYMKNLTLPLEIYTVTERLARMLDVTYAYDTNSKKEKKKSLVMRHPEARLMCLLIVAVKLLFPFDGLPRSPATQSEAAALSLDWQGWTAARSPPKNDSEDGSPHDQMERLHFEDSLRFSQADVFTASDGKLDDFLDHYESTWLDDRINETGRAAREADFRHYLFEQFPPTRADRPLRTEIATAPKDAEILRTVQRSLRPVAVLCKAEAAEQQRRDREVRRPGSYYKRYRRVQDLDGPARVFYAAAAGLTALSLQALVRGVFLMERRLQVWEEAERRRGEGVRSG